MNSAYAVCMNSYLALMRYSAKLMLAGEPVMVTWRSLEPSTGLAILIWAPDIWRISFILAPWRPMMQPINCREKYLKSHPSGPGLQWNAIQYSPPPNNKTYVIWNGQFMRAGLCGGIHASCKGTDTLIFLHKAQQISGQLGNICPQQWPHTKLCRPPQKLVVNVSSESFKTIHLGLSYSYLSKPRSTQIGLMSARLPYCLQSFL